MPPRMPTPNDFPPVVPEITKVFVFEDQEFYHVGGMQRDIAANPNRFKFGAIDPIRLKPQVDGHGNIDMASANAMSHLEASRPLIMITYADSSGSTRLVDGYRRVVKALQLGLPLVGVYVLTADETRPYTLTSAGVDLVRQMKML